MFWKICPIQHITVSSRENGFLEAGITKKIIFHNFHHTFTTLQLFNGTDIYIILKMVGYYDLKTTKIYAKIVDEKKGNTTDKIKLDLYN